MAIYVTARHMFGGTKHEHIAEVKWENRTSEENGKTSMAEMVKWIMNENGDARRKASVVCQGRSRGSVATLYPHLCRWRVD